MPVAFAHMRSMVWRGLHKSSSTLQDYIQTLGLKTLGFFCFTKDRNLKESEYKQLTDHVIEKASGNQFNAELSEEQFQQLIQDKIKRAEVYMKSMKYIDFIR